ncbi:2,4-dienoyl-CoA reductase-like NADH-dependent reductase (Old Yellow Enzyme family) [Labedella gwakjiensis]|uniref:2,4-dienoyl-CoA reductase-like NADH-dependent reductase (Old Yellow Enzyme family) n=1 Tax=Labedella gwakjiensis TaxID=390269 RepID=A0A2P8GY29_9MICO|nr:NADH:flavin oxidoreductase/NADH oxidase [Labedella gwakjiensis]PSL38851.1 2,4-dienoyl-CoA reductase-like NADH-dependent reductase (Old Yellow Enzyme family) [Labedella gwakjiensis]RUQ86681.1 NADH:flavin oxidoreductase/NADH oxidase [Labedella gwakjiensis]
MPAIFEPLTLRSLTIRNRLWVAPMCQYSVEDRDGVPTDWHLVHLGQFAAGGAGLVVTEATAVSPAGRISPQDTGIWNDEQAAVWARIVRFLHSQGAAAGVQLAHAGRKASTFRPWSEERGTVPAEDGGWEPVAPSATPFPGYATPRALDTEEIAGIVADFAAAARRAVEAGFDVLEIHAAHGYLLHEFLSPLSNERTDGYGGSLENRARLLLEVVRAVRAAAGDAVVFVRFSATDWTDGGWNEDDTATVAGWAAAAGANLFDVSTGGNVPATIPTEPAYQVRFATLVRDTVDAPVCAVGLITDPEEAEEIVRFGRADAIMMGRELLRDPHLPLRAASVLGATIDYTPPQYLRAPFA